MAKAGLWKAGRRRVVEVHQWRPRRSRCGELVQWDTSAHDWLEGRGETIYLISMIDDATSRLFARFVRHDTSEENMRLLWSYLEQYGRPLAFYTDKAGHVPGGGQDQTAGAARRAGPAADAADADCAGARRVGHRVDSGAFAASQRARRAPVSDRSRPPGERHARGWGADLGGGQRVPGKRVSALVEQDAGRCSRPMLPTPIGR